MASVASMASATNAKGGDARRLRAALDECGLSLLAQKFAEHGVDDSCLSALEDEDLEAMGIIEPAARGAILAVVKAPPETSSERVAALEARNRELADALDAAAAGAAANEARFTEALQIAGRLRDRVLTLEERNDWLEAGKEDYKKRLQSEAAEADKLRRRVDELASSSARLSRCARRERELRLKTTEGRIDPYDGTPLADDGTPLVDPATGLAVDAPEFAPDAPLVSPDAPSPRASSPEDAPEDPEFAAELARAQANVDRMEALKQGRKVSVVDPSECQRENPRRRVDGVEVDDSARRPLQDSHVRVSGRPRLPARRQLRLRALVDGAAPAGGVDDGRVQDAAVPLLAGGVPLRRRGPLPVRPLVGRVAPGPGHAPPEGRAPVQDEDVQVLPGGPLPLRGDGDVPVRALSRRAHGRPRLDSPRRVHERGPRGHPPPGRVQLARPNGLSGRWPARGQL